VPDQTTEAPLRIGPGLRSSSMAVQIAVIGGGDSDAAAMDAAEIVGVELAKAGAVLICGGLGGVMAAACRGAKSAGGTTVGVLPETDPGTANRWVDVVIPTGLGEARNAIVVRSAGAVVAIDGEYGTLSEIALALRSGVPVIGLATWSLVRPDGETDAGIEVVDDPRAAVTRALVRAAAPR
jgi:uncharacterized protein (TIGR00725 family)